MSLLFPPTAPRPDDPIVCSAKGCRADATRALVWANPTLHHGGRTKTWTACDAHEADLAAFLDVRGFLQEVLPLAEYQRRAGEEGRGPLRLP